MTPIYQIPIKGANVWAKLENENPTGTHKDRSVGPWIAHYVKQGIREFAIASSGNSALSAARYCAKNRLKLHTFLSPASPALIKLQKQGQYLLLHVSNTPRRDIFRFCQKNKDILNLRASTDDNALFGYKQIAYELTKQLPGVDSIFIPTSSGATLEGIYYGFCARRGIKSPHFFAVQTTKVHPIASYFDKNFKREKISLAAAIVDNIAHRRDRIIEICKSTGGGGFVISNKELEEARKTLRGLTPRGGSDPLKAGWHSALAFAGFLKYQKSNLKLGISLCLFTD